MKINNDIGIIGLGVMGKSLARNFASKSLNVTVFNEALPGEEHVTFEFVNQYKELGFYGAKLLSDFVNSLQTPRVVLLMIKSGEPVDEMIEKLIPFLDKNDIIIDAGNSFYKESQKRNEYLTQKGINFVGMGVSGGEEGALKGPAIMPAGSEMSKTRLMPMLEKIAAKVEGEPCVKWVGKDGAGHFAKMVHNGIEYADMQLLSEAYGICKDILKMSNLEIADYFETWMKSYHSSYLLEITIDILRKKEDDRFILDEILDVAGHKGTGMWTSREALELGVAVPGITSAMNQRIISAYKSDRIKFEVKEYEIDDLAATILKERLESAVLCGRFIAFAEGFHLMEVASEKNNWGLKMAEIASIWRGGCIIRSAKLPIIMHAFSSNRHDKLNHLFHAPTFFSLLEESIDSMNISLSILLLAGYPTPCLSATNQYFHSFTSATLPINMIQAQRDYFGAHTYKTIENPAISKHTIWKTH